MSSNFFSQGLAMSTYRSVFLMENACSTAELVPVFVDTGLEFQSKQRLITFDDEMRFNSTQKCASLLASEDANKLNAPFGVAQIMPVFVEGAAIRCGEILDNGQVCHANTANDLISNMPRVGFLPTSDSDPALTVEKTGSVNVVHSFLPGRIGIVANSVKTLCPAERCGRAIPSQASARQALGVCNEHVPLAEAKMCSELHGNMQKSAEMTGSDGVFISHNIHHQVTDCTTDYIHYRPHVDRNMVPLDPDRFSVNQDAMVKLIAWAGNMTLSNRFLQGVITA